MLFRQVFNECFSWMGYFAVVDFTRSSVFLGEVVMTNCKDCEFFFPVAEDADDYAAAKGDCVVEKRDEKGQYWLSKPVSEGDDCCENYRQGSK